MDGQQMVVPMREQNNVEYFHGSIIFYPKIPNKTLKVPYNTDRMNRIYCYLMFSELSFVRTDRQTDGRGLLLYPPLPFWPGIISLSCLCPCYYLTCELKRCEMFLLVSYILRNLRKLST